MINLQFCISCILWLCAMYRSTANIVRENEEWNSNQDDTGDNTSRLARSISCGRYFGGEGADVKMHKWKQRPLETQCCMQVIVNDFYGSFASFPPGTLDCLASDDRNEDSGAKVVETATINRGDMTDTDWELRYERMNKSLDALNALNASFAAVRETTSNTNARCVAAARDTMTSPHGSTVSQPLPAKTDLFPRRSQKASRTTLITDEEECKRDPDLPADDNPYLPEPSSPSPDLLDNSTSHDEAAGHDGRVDAAHNTALAYASSRHDVTMYHGVTHTDNPSYHAFHDIVSRSVDVTRSASANDVKLRDHASRCDVTPIDVGAGLVSATVPKPSPSAVSSQGPGSRPGSHADVTAGHDVTQKPSSTSQYSLYDKWKRLASWIPNPFLIFSKKTQSTTTAPVDGKVEELYSTTSALIDTNDAYDYVDDLTEKLNEHRMTDPSQSPTSSSSSKEGELTLIEEAVRTTPDVHKTKKRPGVVQRFIRWLRGMRGPGKTKWPATVSSSTDSSRQSYGDEPTELDLSRMVAHPDMFDITSDNRQRPSHLDVSQQDAGYVSTEAYDNAKAQYEPSHCDTRVQLASSPASVVDTKRYQIPASRPLSPPAESPSVKLPAKPAKRELPSDHDTVEEPPNTYQTPQNRYQIPSNRGVNYEIPQRKRSADSHATTQATAVSVSCGEAKSHGNIKQHKPPMPPTKISRCKKIPEKRHEYDTIITNIPLYQQPSSRPKTPTKKGRCCESDSSSGQPQSSQSQLSLLRKSLQMRRLFKKSRKSGVPNKSSMKKKSAYAQNDPTTAKLSLPQKLSQQKRFTTTTTTDVTTSETKTGDDQKQDCAAKRRRHKRIRFDFRPASTDEIFSARSKPIISISDESISSIIHF